MAERQEWCPDSWERGTFSHGGHAHAFYIVHGPAPSAPRPSVLLMHEFPGISDNLVMLANRLADDFRVVVPSIFGRDGTPSTVGSLRELCVRREVHAFARDGVSRSVPWLREFADAHVAGTAERPYGVIGMCFTGNFALALAVDPRVRAAVVAQPALPVLPRALGLSAEDTHSLRNRVELQVQGYRFRKDCMSPAAKLAAAQELLGGERMRVFPLEAPNATKHSTLTGRWRSENAIAAVTDFLNERLAA